MLKGLLIAAIVLVCLGVIAVSYIVPNIHVHEQSTASGSRVRVETPFGSVRVDGHENASIDIGNIPIYPGAERAKSKSGGAAVDVDWGSGETKIGISRVEYVTDDSVSKVRDWYRNQLPDWHTTDKQMVHMEGGMKRFIDIKEHDGRTRIGIASIGAPESN